jgi:hypothetical protein
VTDHVVRGDDPWRPPDAVPLGLRRETFADYLAEIAAQAERACHEYDLLLVPGLELTYNDLDPLAAAHAVAVGCRRFVGVDDGIETALRAASEAGAALVAAHPYRGEPGAASPARATQRFARDWEVLAPLVDRWELFNRNYGWKTLLPCAKDERDVVGYLRSTRPAFLTRIDEMPLRRAA